jgi:ankyrin
MRDLILRFPHVAEQIFQQLDNKSLAKCRNVERLWQKFIDERNYPWLRIVNIPTILQDRVTYMHLAVQYGQTNMFEIILDKEENKNAKNCNGETPFLVACRKGHLNIALILLKKSDELQIDLNVKNRCDKTAFHLACDNGHLEIADMIMKNSSELKIDLNSKDNFGHTAFHQACLRGDSEIAEMIMKKSSKLKIDLNSKNNGGKTAFHLACQFGYIRIVDMMIGEYLLFV